MSSSDVTQTSLLNNLGSSSISLVDCLITMSRAYQKSNHLFLLCDRVCSMECQNAQFIDYNHSGTILWLPWTEKHHRMVIGGIWPHTNPVWTTRPASRTFGCYIGEICASSKSTSRKTELVSLIWSFTIETNGSNALNTIKNNCWCPKTNTEMVPPQFLCLGKF